LVSVVYTYYVWSLQAAGLQFASRKLAVHEKPLAYAYDADLNLRGRGKPVEFRLVPSTGPG